MQNSPFIFRTITSRRSAASRPTWSSAAGHSVLAGEFASPLTTSAAHQKLYPKAIRECTQIVAPAPDAEGTRSRFVSTRLPAPDKTLTLDWITPCHSAQKTGPSLTGHECTLVSVLAPDTPSFSIGITVSYGAKIQRVGLVETVKGEQLERLCAVLPHHTHTVCPHWCAVLSWNYSDGMREESIPHSSNNQDMMEATKKNRWRLSVRLWVYLWATWRRKGSHKMHIILQLFLGLPEISRSFNILKYRQHIRTRAQTECACVWERGSLSFLLF